MAITISSHLEDELKEQAERRSVSVDVVVDEALSWYVQLDEQMRSEFKQIEGADAEALYLIEDAQP